MISTQEILTYWILCNFAGKLKLLDLIDNGWFQFKTSMKFNRWVTEIKLFENNLSVFILYLYLRCYVKETWLQSYADIEIPTEF